MKPFKITAILILFLLLMQGILLPRISSRVEGTIVDEETGNPIAGASVGLFTCRKFGGGISYMPGLNHKTNTFYFETDSKGYFIFDDLLKYEYFLVVFKEGYAAIGPFFYKKPDMFEDTEGYAFTSKDVDSFTLEEGQIKHFKIKMEKEAILKVTVLRKIFTGIEPIDTFKATIWHPGFIDKFATTYRPPAKKKIPIKNDMIKFFQIKSKSIENGFQTIYFKKGNVSLIIEANGYPPKTFENLLLEKGQTTSIEYIADFTKPPVIYGKIKNKDTEDKYPVAHIMITKQDEPEKYLFLESYSKDGKFFLGGMIPGKYLLNMSASYGEKDFQFKTLLNISSDSFVEINKEF